MRAGSRIEMPSDRNMPSRRQPASRPPVGRLVAVMVGENRRRRSSSSSRSSRSSIMRYSTITHKTSETHGQRPPAALLEGPININPANPLFLPAASISSSSSSSPRSSSSSSSSSAGWQWHDGLKRVCWGGGEGVVQKPGRVERAIHIASHRSSAPCAVCGWIAQSGKPGARSHIPPCPIQPAANQRLARFVQGLNRIDHFGTSS